MTINTITRKEYNKLPPEIKLCIHWNGRRGYEVKGKYHCDIYTPVESCPCYDDGCKVEEYKVEK